LGLVAIILFVLAIAFRLLVFVVVGGSGHYALAGLQLSMLFVLEKPTLMLL
jgi:hypothetical protein